MGINLLAGLLGIIFVVLSKMSALKKDFEVANQVFVTKRFFEKEAIAISSSIVSVLILVVVLPEILTYKPELTNWVRGLFTVTGAIGSWAFSLFLGGTKKYIRGVVDSKTNELDDIKKSA
jgi:uncharacterized membrane protein